MVKGLDIFRERFAAHTDKFVLIGGSACHEWLAREHLAFRATRDFDIVLVVEVLDAGFVAALRAFVEEGGYEIRERAVGEPELHRFQKPARDNFPAILEFFSRRPGTIDLGPDQRIVPIAAGDAATSLSAILLDDEYYALIIAHREIVADLPIAIPTALIPLKARAWLDMAERKRTDDASVDQKNIDKHRTDVFRLAATLPAEPGPELAAGIRADLARFLAAFPDNSPQWTGSFESLKTTFPNQKFTAAILREALTIFFRLA